MTRYIIIDAFSGYIWGDTAQFVQAGQECPSDIATVCKMLDESIGETGRTYEEVPRLSGDSGYIVYRADVDDSDSEIVIHDGQDQKTIEAVERYCERVGYVEWRSRDESANYF